MTKKETVISLLEQGKSVAEISKELNMLYQNVWRIARDYEWQKELERLRNA
jgi:hypothetical protein